MYMGVFRVKDFKILVKEIELKDEISYRDTPVLKYSIKYPHFTSNIFQYFVGRLNQYYRNQAYSLLRYCEGKLCKEAVLFYNDSIVNGFTFHEYEFMLRYIVSYNQDCMLSLYFDQFQYTGGATGRTYKASNSWNVKSCRGVGLNELFPMKKRLKDYIAMKVIEEIAVQIKGGTNIDYFDNYEKLVAQYFDPRNFYITPYDVNVYFQEVTIALRSSGIPVFGILYEMN